MPSRGRQEKKGGEPGNNQAPGSTANLLASLTNNMPRNKQGRIQAIPVVEPSLAEKQEVLSNIESLRQSLQPHEKKVLDNVMSKGGGRGIYINGRTQTIYYIEDDKMLLEGPVSTSYKGFGNEDGSGKTTIGVRQGKIAVGFDRNYVSTYDKKAGREKRVGPGREVEDKAFQENPEQGGKKAYVLYGFLEVDSDRGIGIHATNREQVLKIPASGGCIRMDDDDFETLMVRHVQPNNRRPWIGISPDVDPEKIDAKKT